MKRDPYARYKPAFIGHGSPLNAIAKNAYADFLSRYARAMATPEAIVVVSAHWQTEGTYITGSERPEQLYDFYGFPNELYSVRYAPPGSKRVAESIGSALADVGVDYTRGIDHAAWAVVKHLFPEGNVPVLEMSLDTQKSPAEHFALGRRMRSLKDSAVLFIGSGNMVHNLRDISFDDEAEPFPWAVRADEWLARALAAGDVGAIVDYERSFPDFKRSIPTNEHFLPLLYILGMRDEAFPIKTIYEELQNGSISMRSVEVA